MKSAKIWLFLGVMATGLSYSRAPILAQPVSDPVSTDDDPVSTDDDPTSTDDKRIVIEDANAPWSQGVSTEERRAARKLFLDGNRLFRIPLFAKAAEQYTAALNKWKHPAFYFNLALAQLNLGKEIETYESLEHSLKYGETPLGEEQFKEAQKQLAEVKRQIGRIRVTCRTPGAEVTLDGVTIFIGPGSYEGWAKAEHHEITAKKVGYLSEARRVAVSPGALQEIQLRLVTLSQATDAGRRWTAWKPWAVIASGGVIAAAGGTLHAFSAKNYSTYDDAFLKLGCVMMPRREAPGCTKNDTADLNSRLSRARQQQIVAVGAYITGGSLIVTGAVLLYLNRPRLMEQEAIRSSTRKIEIRPAMASGLLGIWLTVSH